MDCLTNSLSGLLLARAGLGRMAPHGTVLLLLALNIPDIDNAARLQSQLARLEWHAGYTHSLLALPVMAVLCVFVTSLLFRERPSWLRSGLLAGVGVACHLLLDYVTSWGLRPLLPFSSRWFYLDWNTDYDAILLTVLGFAAVWPHFSKLVSGEIGAPGKIGRGSALVGLILFVLFEMARALSHQQATAEAGSRLFDGEQPIRAAALPYTFNPLKWREIIETDSNFRVLPINIMDSFDAEAGPKFYKIPESAAMRRAKRTEPFQYFQYFARFPLWTVQPVLLEVGAGERVVLTDLRIGDPAQKTWGSVAIEDGSGHMLATFFAENSAQQGQR